MSESPILQVLHTLAALAWADGVLTDEEAESLRRFLGTFSLSESELAIAQSWLTTPVELDTSDLASLPEGRRLGMYQVAVRMAAADGEIGDAERAMLENLREALGLDEQTANDIEAELPTHD